MSLTPIRWPAGVVGLAAAVCWPFPAVGQESLFPSVTIAGSRAECVSVTTVSGLLEYRYRVVNPSTSDAGVNSLAVDASAPLGMTPDLLPTSGLFIGDVTKVSSKATAGHVPVGMDLPPQWRGLILENGMIRWRALGAGLRSADPIPPGGSREDLVLRSSYLPGVRQFELLPDYPHICCPYRPGDPRNDAIQVKTPEDFRSAGLTIGPTYAPDDVTLPLTRDLLDAACQNDWITQPGVCHSLQVKLDNASAALARGDPGAATGQLRAFLNELEAQHGPEPGKHVTDNGYWLLKINVEHLLSRL